MQNDDNIKIGISGGTFDPVHYGHLITASKVKEAMKLDKVIFVPTGNPPHKRNKKVTDAQHRYNMLCCAVNSYFDFEVCRIEIDRKGLTYTIDTLMEFKRLYGLNSSLFFITGADVIHDLLTWKDIERVFTLCEFTAVLRPGFDRSSFLLEIEELRCKYNARINVLEIPQIDISSTMIRNRVKNGQSIADFVPSCVENYINTNNLYKY